MIHYRLKLLDLRSVLHCITFASLILRGPWLHDPGETKAPEDWRTPKGRRRVPYDPRILSQLQAPEVPILVNLVRDLQSSIHKHELVAVEKQPADILESMRSSVGAEL
jgi:hypothetical protein